MRKSIATLAAIATLIVTGASASAASVHKTASTTKTAVVTSAAVTHPSYCGPGAYNTSYRAIYEYPTGSYWQTQIHAYPDYYAANNAYYLATYGC